MKIRTAPQWVVDKYSVYAKDYIEYPGKEQWQTDYDPLLADKAIDELGASQDPTVLYLHMPFCPQMCFFCLCHFKITHDYSNIKRAVAYLEYELCQLGERREIPLFKELHFGGGSPTYIREVDLELLCDEVRAATGQSLEDFDEVSLEIDPRRVGTDRLHFYADLGIDRLSFGIQEFDRTVQEQINRVQPPELIENLMQVRRRFKSINFDMLIGLPGQTLETVERTTLRLVSIGPDRVALSYMHYNPAVHKHQGAMTRNGFGLPGFRERKEMHELATEILEASGYIRTGMEHFAKPHDEVALAKVEGKAQYNSLGATSGRCDWLLGLGESAYSRVGPYHYTQNFYERDKYEAAVDVRRLPVWRGHHLTGDDLVRRDVIQKIRVDFEIDLQPINEKYHIDASPKFRGETRILEVMEKDGLLLLTKTGRGDVAALQLTELGKCFANVVCRAFDRYSWGGRSVDEFFAAPKVSL
jgi:oxygen-independent coproporphyrinogen-3 oxidase